MIISIQLSWQVKACLYYDSEYVIFA